MGALAFYLFIALSISFLCSILEAVLLSITPAYIQVAKKKGKKSALILEKFKSEINAPLTAILTLNTISHTIGAAGVGAQVLKIWGNAYVTLGSILLTVGILVFSEIVPKTLGTSYWRGLAPLCAYLIKTFIYITYPLVISSQFLHKKILSKPDPNTEEEMNQYRNEVVAAADLSMNKGALFKQEKNVIENLIKLQTVLVSEIMTPRSVICAYEEDTSVDDVLDDKSQQAFSRIPVYKKDLDHITGRVLRYDLLEAHSEQRQAESIKEFAEPVHFVPENISCAAALNQFLKRRDHMFLVRGENEQIVGLVTLEDVIETLLGVEIIDESDSVTDMRAYALMKWQKKTKIQSSKKGN